VKWRRVTLLIGADSILDLWSCFRDSNGFLSPCEEALTNSKPNRRF